MRLTLILAATKSNGIGQNGRLPWRLPKEMAYFSRVTSKAPEGYINAVLMGRKTWESIPTKFKPLPGRSNIVISGNEDYQLLSPNTTTRDPVHLIRALDSALRQISKPHPTQIPPIHRCFVIGGASLYCETLALVPSTDPGFVDRILLTRILSPTFDQCDVYMPNFLSEKAIVGDAVVGWERAPHSDLQSWVGFEVPEGIQQENGTEYEFQMWVRRC